jgi:quercetin dioxygenase-like cupin family protein
MANEIPTYRIEVQGQLPTGVAEEWPGLSVERTGDTTVLTGPVADQSALYGLLRRLEALGVALVAVGPGAAGPEPRTDTTPEEPTMEHPLEGWDIGRFADLDWAPWGSGDRARAKVLGTANGFVVSLVEARPGYAGDPHVHAFPEFLYVVEGKVRNQGREMVVGDGYAAAPGSSHTDFAAPSGATYLSIFKL